MPDSDVFILTAVREPDAGEAIRRAVEQAEVQASRVQDAVFGLDGSRPLDAQDLLGRAGLSCPTVTVASGLRAIFFAAQSILSGDAEIVVVTLLEKKSALAL